MKEYEKAIQKMGTEAANQYVKLKAELVALGQNNDVAGFEKWLSRRKYVPRIRKIDLTELFPIKMMTGQAVQGYIVLPLIADYVMMLQTGNGCDVFKAEDFTDVDNPPYGKHVFRPVSMGYKVGLLVSAYLLRHKDEIYHLQHDQEE